MDLGHLRPQQQLERARDTIRLRRSFGLGFPKLGAFVPDRPVGGHAALSGTARGAATASAKARSTLISISCCRHGRRASPFVICIAAHTNTLRANLAGMPPPATSWPMV